jgi:hypothetical protein
MNTKHRLILAVALLACATGCTLAQFNAGVAHVGADIHSVASKTATIAGDIVLDTGTAAVAIVTTAVDVGKISAALATATQIPETTPAVTITATVSK